MGVCEEEMWRRFGGENPFHDVMRDSAKKIGTETAISSVDNRCEVVRSISYFSFFEKSRNLALYMRHELGIQCGDRVLLVFPPSHTIDFVLSFFACLYLGAVAVPAYPVDPTKKEKELPRFIEIVQTSCANHVLSTKSYKRALKLLTLSASSQIWDGLKWTSADELCATGLPASFLEKLSTRQNAEHARGLRQQGGSSRAAESKLQQIYSQVRKNDFFEGSQERAKCFEETNIGGEIQNRKVSETWENSDNLKSTQEGTPVETADTSQQRKRRLSHLDWFESEHGRVLFAPQIVTPDSLAFLQFTSGSTSAPKGVQVTVGSLLHNVHLVVRACNFLSTYEDELILGNNKEGGSNQGSQKSQLDKKIWSENHTEQKAAKYDKASNGEKSEPNINQNNVKIVPEQSDIGGTNCGETGVLNMLSADQYELYEYKDKFWPLRHQRSKMALSHRVRSFSWLPAYHDMGLIGCIISPLSFGLSVYLLSPLDFIRRPYLWLEGMSKYECFTSGGPNFGFDLVTRKMPEEVYDKLNLSLITSILCGAEPIRVQTYQKFIEKYSKKGFRESAFLPAYGLAENTLIVTGRHRALAKPLIVSKMDDYVSTNKLDQNRIPLSPLSGNKVQNRCLRLDQNKDRFEVVNYRYGLFCVENDESKPTKKHSVRDDKMPITREGREAETASEVEKIQENVEKINIRGTNQASGKLEDAVNDQIDQGPGREGNKEEDYQAKGRIEEGINEPKSTSSLTQERKYGNLKCYIGCGRVCPGVVVKIVDPYSMEEKGEGEIGEIWIAGSSMAQGYYRNEDETRRTFNLHINTQSSPKLFIKISPKNTDIPPSPAYCLANRQTPNNSPICIEDTAEDTNNDSINGININSNNDFKEGESSSLPVEKSLKEEHFHMDGTGENKTISVITTDVPPCEIDTSTPEAVFPTNDFQDSLSPPTPRGCLISEPRSLQTNGSNSHTFLRTGDLGAFFKKELFVTGRIKDVLIIRGKNYYPQDIEAEVEQIGEVRKGCVAVFPVDNDGEEAVGIALEIRPSTESLSGRVRSWLKDPVRSLNQPHGALVQKVIRAVYDACSLPIHAMWLLKPRSLPKTTSGKIRRNHTKEALLSSRMKGVLQKVEQPVRKKERKST